MKHYPNGVMTEHFFSLKEGDKLSIKGPIPKFAYKTNEFKVRPALSFHAAHPPVARGPD